MPRAGFYRAWAKIIAATLALFLLAGLSWGVSRVERAYEAAETILDAHHRTQEMLREMMEILKERNQK